MIITNNVTCNYKKGDKNEKADSSNDSGNCDMQCGFLQTGEKR